MMLFLRLIGGLVLIVVLLAAVSLVLPRQVNVERSAGISAPPDAIFPYVNSLKRTQEWSPWLERDPDVAVTFDGPDEGVGAQMAWVSDQRDVGSGSQEIVSSTPNERVETALDFGDMGTALAYFTLAGEGSETTVTWGFDTDTGYNPMARWMGLMFDDWVGADYEDGLARLKALVESQAAQ